MSPTANMDEAFMSSPQLKQDDLTDVLVKKYENMSFHEMSQEIAESNKLISKILSSTSSTTTTTTMSDESNENDDKETFNKWTNMFIKATFNGDIDKLRELLMDDNIRPCIDINAKDKDGTLPITYAACFGKFEVVKLLVEAGANIDAQDNFGWTALMWATSNNYEALTKFLLDHGASSQTKSSNGRTVYDFINTDNQKMLDILATNPRDSISSTSSLIFKTTSSAISSSTSSTNDYYYQINADLMSEEAEIRQKLFDLTITAADDDLEYDQEDNVDFNENEFHWDKCSPDQMFVFNSDDLDSILDTIITNIQLPLSNQQDIYIPSNVIFLCARFSHYYSTFELLEQVLNGALNRIEKTININTKNLQVLAFWITNLTRLLYYLRKDSNLVSVTAEHQLHISELISETYNLIVQDIQKKLSKLLSPAILDYEEIQVIGQVMFADDWYRYFRKSFSKQTTGDNIESLISPTYVTSLLSSTLFVLQSYDVHPIIIIQAMAQLFHFISCELFNRMLVKKTLLCRSKAMQVRLNLSHLQDWISSNGLPKHLWNYLTPTLQLLQLLQCLTLLKDLMDFINTIKEFDTLNAAQIKRCVLSYRYEVNEQKLPEEIVKYTIQCVQDTLKNKQKHAKSLEMSRESTQTNDNGLKPSIVIINDKDIQELYDDNDDNINEAKDSKFMLPFSVPTVAHMTSPNSYSRDINSSNENNNNNNNQPRQMIPIIPEEWMNHLDKQTSNV